MLNGRCVGVLVLCRGLHLMGALHLLRRRDTHSPHAEPVAHGSLLALAGEILDGTWRGSWARRNLSRRTATWMGCSPGSLDSLCVRGAFPVELSEVTAQLSLLPLIRAG